MKPDDLKPWFDAARQMPAPKPTDDFPDRVLSAIAQLPEPAPLLSQMADLFPRWAAVAGVILVLAVGTDYWTSEGSFTELVSEVTLVNSDGPLAWPGL